MKKKLVLIVIILVIGIFVFLENVCKISVIEGVKQIVIGQTKMFDNEKNIKKNTVVDVTDLEDNGNIEHEHIFKTMYDENYHWEECTICGQKNDIIEHSFTTTWALGEESCSPYNCATKMCICGYSYIWHKPCVWNEKYSTYTDSARHFYKCSICNEYIAYQYYKDSYGRGELYNSIGYENCYTNNGKLLNCTVEENGKCAKCGYYHYKSDVTHIAQQVDNKIICSICNKEFGTYSSEIIKDENVFPTYTVKYNITFMDGAKFYSAGKEMHNYWQINKQTVTNVNTDKTNIIVTTTLKAKSNIKVPVLCIIRFYATDKNGRKITIDMVDCIVIPELQKPNILSLTEENNTELTQWSRTKPIIISGTENYCDSVSVKIIDENENTIFEGKTNVNTENYSISCTPELEIDTNGKTFKAIVTDSCGNTTEQEFTISKVDAIAPTPTSDDKILGDWSKSKDFTFTATDYGIGQVKIAFNDIEDLQLATEDGKTYTRDYTFTGDVYKEKQLSVLYKDGLGNTSIQKVTINRIDNTAPTITKAELQNNIIKITSNDEHERLGEGSGVIKYRYLASEEKIEKPELTTENSIEVNKDEKIMIKDIYKVKYVYLVAKDYVGNISNIYEFEVPQLVLTSKVNQSAANGKGEVILEWSSYDVTNKYFVIYRKEENQENWETIVSLEQKLTGNTYTDKLGNDEEKPNIPTININGDSENNINIIANSIDNGNRYTYYIESYDIDSNSLINISNLTN